MARVGAPHGLRGYFFLRLFTRDPSFFISFKQWWCRLPDGDWQLVDVEDCRLQGNQWLAKFTTIDDRDAAISWRGADLAILREQIPPAADGEEYWHDLIGLRVVNTEDKTIGKITGVWDIGAHDVLEICADDDGRQILLPFVSAYIISSDVAAGVVRVDWQPEW